MIRQLRVLDGPDKGKVFELPASGTVLIGRAKDTLTQLTDRTASRYHCRLEVDGDRVLVTNSSESGILVNDQSVTEHPLRERDVIRLGHSGDTRFVLEIQDVHAEATVRGKEDLQQAISQELKNLAGKPLGHFRLDRILAEGPSGVIFHARDTGRDRDVALKVFSLDPTNVRTLAQAFPAIQPVVGLTHPNLVTLYETGNTEGYFWVAMEPVVGESLRKLLEQSGLSGVIDWQQVLRFGTQLAGGLDALHRSQVIHRNVTPDSIFIARGDRQAKLGGLWRARAARDCLTGTADTQEVLRSVPYMPPERLRGGQPATVRGDIYSLGAVLYHLLAGRPPFHGPNDADLINRIVQTEPAPLREFQRSVPAALERVVLRMLAKSLDDRYPSAAELLAALQGVAAEGTAPERSSAPPPPSAEAAPPTPAAPTRAAPPPPHADGEETIQVGCRCGQTLQARKQFAGTRARCPHCGNFVDLPGRAPFDQAAASVSRAPAGPHRPAPKWKSAAPKARKSFLGEVWRYFMLMVILVGALVVSLSGMVCNSDLDTAPSEKTKPDVGGKQPGQPKVANPPR